MNKRMNNNDGKNGTKYCCDAVNKSGGQRSSHLSGELSIVRRLCVKYRVFRKRFASEGLRSLLEKKERKKEENFDR